MLKTTRGFWKTLLLTIITIGIYAFVQIHLMAKEANWVDSHSKRVGGLLFYILISIITLGIYALYWNFRVCEKFGNVVRSTGQSPRISGVAWLLWTIVGAFIIVGPIIALVLQLHLWNDANMIYNARH